MSQQNAWEYLRHGLTPFFRLSGVQEYKSIQTKAVLLGVPWDRGTTYRPGTRFGPYSIRQVSGLIQGYHAVYRLNVFDKTNAVDGGNVVFAPFDAGAMREAVEKEVSQVLEAEAVPFLVGGDHSISLPALRALAKKYGPVASVHIDAHRDISGPEIWLEEYHHGTPFRHALEEGCITSHRFFQVGIRGPMARAIDDKYAKNSRIYSMEECALGVESIAGEIRASIGDSPVYLSLDIDALDPAFAPATGTPVPGGFSSREAISFLRGLAGVNLVGMDLVEVCPPLDHAEITAHLAAHLLFEGLALCAIKSGFRE